MFIPLRFQDLAPPLKPTNVTLKSYTGKQIKILSATEQKQQLELLVVPGDGPSLLGRDWLGLKTRLDTFKSFKYYVSCVGLPV